MSITAYRKNLREGLHGADLAVGVLECDRGHRWAVSNGAPQRLGREATHVVNAQGSLVRVGLLHLAQEERLVDGRGEHPGADTPTRVPQPCEARAQGVCPAGVEGHLVGTGAQRRGEALSGTVEKVTGLATLAVEAPRICPARVEGRKKGLASGGMQRAAGGVQHA